MQTYNPVSTYRIQFNKDFTFKQAENIISYLEKLGVKTIYASPIFKAVEGSNHGYDVTDPLKINPEIGTEEDFYQLIKTLQEKNMGWIQDIVPNHMAYSTENPWLYDVLLKGRESVFHFFFDILRNHPDPQLSEKIMLPFFGSIIEEVIKNKELQLAFDEKGFYLVYFDNRYPVSQQAYPIILQIDPEKTSPDIIRSFLEFDNKKEDWKNQVATLYQDYQNNADIKQYVDEIVTHFNEDDKKMQTLVTHLSYLPTHWKTTERKINYRRFFTINGLICLNIHDDRVFDIYHELISTWIDKNTINGVRVDHIDGLYNPGKYLKSLRELCGEKTYLVVEKILEKDETLESSWPVEGSTGYDFLGIVNSLLTNTKNMDLLHSYYREWKNKSGDFETVSLQKKRFILYNRLQGELDNLTTECMAIDSIMQEEYQQEEIKKAIGEFLVHCPVYKIYNTASTLSAQHKALLQEILNTVIEKSRGKNHYYTIKALEELFISLDHRSDKEIKQIDAFFRHCMQFTGPLMAKGVEDTAFYSYNPFIAHNEVGDTPGDFGINAAGFHSLMQDRLEKFPLTMNVTATHDTKRGEDARARLNVISDIPEKWIQMTRQWRALNADRKIIHDGEEIPTANDEYFIYQTICAHLPMDAVPDDSFIERIQEYFTKVMREAKETSSWSSPDTVYENNALKFIKTILTDKSKFLNTYLSFMKDIIPQGIVNSITQLILKNTVPGVPDTFQGSETWNLSFVDPDNRSPVDYEFLSGNLRTLKGQFTKNPEKTLQRLWENANDGNIKQWISYITLKERQEREPLFLKGEYIPLEVKGKYKEYVVAFCRRYRDDWLLVILPLNTAEKPLGNDWKNTRVKLPAFSPPKWENRLTKNIHKPQEEIRIEDAFEIVPFGLFGGVPHKPERRAGILMHVSSLPGSYGIGDFGESSKRFIDFLQETGQRYWQILPLNITSQEMGYSPYSSYSAFAGNVLFLDPKHLINLGLLSSTDISSLRIKSTEKVNFAWAEKAKNSILSEAFENYKSGSNPDLKEDFANYKENEEYWIHDYALFLATKKHFNDKPWNEWPEAYRDRQPQALQEIRNQYAYDIERTIFGQFIFYKQWQIIKQYAHDKGVDIFGDLPIYISYDSADVWAHPDLFRLNENKSMEAVAGVPPDYFNENGQLWGMPLFRWDLMKKDNYSWWIKRIEKNLEWFDLLRLDHFRGFSAYWAVPAEDDVALYGKWVPGPGNEFFDAIKKEFPDMPLVAEDLGQIDQAVYDLRDDYNLPGMKVVQFGFGDNMPFLQHVPNNHEYNSIAYSGTHDNNTMRGWFRKEVDDATLKRIKRYTGKKLKEKNCHTEMIRLTYASVAKLAIIPMQDWLGLDENSRMNFPSTTEGNWLWRMKPNMLTDDLKKKMKRMVRTFGRY